MSYSRFNVIDKAIRYTNKPVPTAFEEKFHDVRQMIDTWNNHMASLMALLPHESMNTWLNKYCPSFMIVPRKQHPYGNKYHSIADGDKGYPIMWQFESYSKTAKLMQEIMENIHGTCKIVSMYSGFVLLQEFLQCMIMGSMVNYW
ncbi:hypothetical protein ACHAXN_012748 [Cyclotella atomus]